ADRRSTRDAILELIPGSNAPSPGARAAARRSRRHNGAMPEIELFNPAGLAPPSGFAHAAAAGDLVVLGGQTGSDATRRIAAPGDLAATSPAPVRNVATARRAAGSGPERALKLTYYVTDVRAYRASLGPIGAAYREVFGRHYPATSLFEVGGLFDPDALVEIECMA